MPSVVEISVVVPSVVDISVVVISVVVPSVVDISVVVISVVLNITSVVDSMAMVPVDSGVVVS